MAHRFLVAGLICLTIAAAAYGALHVTRGPQPIFVHIRWAPDVDDITRQVTERRYSLSDAEQLEGRTWGYTLADLSPGNIRALVTDPAVEDTQDIDRTAFQASPAAESRPYPPSLIRISLWVVTALGMFLGVTAVALGLIERAAPGTAFARFAQRPAADHRPGTTETLSLLVITGLVAGCFLVARTMDLRADEENHLSHIHRYLAGNYAAESMTTPVGFPGTAAIFAWLTGHSGKEDIRLFALLLSGGAILTFRSLVKSSEPRASTMRTLQFVLFPLLFPFWFLIYTDVYALLLLLLAILALTRDRFHATGILMILSVAVRQTYVVWLALAGVWTALVNFAGLRALIKRGASFGIAAALFLLFVLVNRGVALGDRDRHPDMEFHTENLCFMLVCFFLLFLPLIVSKLPQIARLHPALLIGVPLSSVVLFFGTFQVDHPYNVLTETNFLRNAMLDAMTSSASAGVATSAAIALAALSLFVIRLRQPLHYLIYPFAALSVLPMWLIEQRYYLPAFALFMLFRESSSPGVERTMVVMNGAVALYLFTGVVQGRFFL